MNNNNIFDTSFVSPENVFVSDDKRRIEIIQTTQLHDYCLYNTDTTKQATPWVNGKAGKVVFNDLNPEIKYSIRVRQADNDQKPEIHYEKTLPLVDDENTR